MKGELEKAVNRLPIFEKKNIYVDGQLQKYFRAVCETGKSDAVAIVSDKYTLVQLRDSFGKVLAKLPEEIEGRVYEPYRGKGAMMVFPIGKNVGLWVVNSVDGKVAIRTHFVVRVNGGSVFIPHEVAGYRRTHRGKALLEYEDFLTTISNVEVAWQQIVDKLSKKLVVQEDIDAFKRICKKRLAKHLEDFIEARKLANISTTVWDLMLETIKTISARRFKTEMNREEKLRAVSFAIFAYCLKG